MLDRRWNEKVLTKTFRIPEDFWKKIEAYKMKKYPGWGNYSNWSEIIRELIEKGLNEDEKEK